MVVLGRALGSRYSKGTGSKGWGPGCTSPLAKPHISEPRIEPGPGSRTFANESVSMWWRCPTRMFGVVRPLSSERRRVRWMDLRPDPKSGDFCALACTPVAPGAPSLHFRLVRETVHTAARLLSRNKKTTVWRHHRPLRHGFRRWQRFCALG